MEYTYSIEQLQKAAAYLSKGFPWTSVLDAIARALDNIPNGELPAAACRQTIAFYAYPITPSDLAELQTNGFIAGFEPKDDDVASSVFDDPDFVLDDSGSSDDEIDGEFFDLGDR